LNALQFACAKARADVKTKQKTQQQNTKLTNWSSSSCPVRASRVPLFGVFFLPCRLASDGHAQLLLGRGFLFCLPFIRECLFPAIPPLSADATFCHTGPRCFFLLPAATLQLPSLRKTPLTPPCVTGFFLITDPSSCYYSNPLLYNMPFYMRFHKGPI